MQGMENNSVFLSSLLTRKDASFYTGDLFSLGMTRIGTVPAGTRVRQVLLQLLYVDSHQVV